MQHRNNQLEEMHRARYGDKRHGASMSSLGCATIPVSCDPWGITSPARNLCVQQSLLPEYCPCLLGSFCPLGPAHSSRLAPLVWIPYLPRASQLWSDKRCVSEWVSVGSTHCTQPGMLAAAAGWAAPGTGTGPGSMWGCSWTRCTTHSFCCMHPHVNEGNVMVPRGMETSGTTEPQRRCDSPGSGNS